MERNKFWRKIHQKLINVRLLEAKFFRILWKGNGIMARRKSDKQKLKDGYGQGRGKSYKPWIRVHEFGSSGRATRLLGFRTRRVHSFLSDLEFNYFLIAEWGDNVIDIREQYPLLPIEQTVLIGEELNIRHPSENNREGKEFVMTTDFVITIQDEDGSDKNIARTIKPSNNLTKRVKEKFKIEEEYWRIKGVDWGVVTEKEIPKILAENLKYLYSRHYWLENMGIAEDLLPNLIESFINLHGKYNGNLDKVVEEFDRKNYWTKGESWNFVEYMILKKIAKVNLIDKRFCYNGLEIKF